jgi:hypothetical protein
MKKFTILVATTLLLACSSTYPRGELYFFGPQRPAAVLAGWAGESDPGLALYRDPRSRWAVESFYAGVAGDAQLGRIILQQASAYEIPLPLAFALAWGESQFDVRAQPQSPIRGPRPLPAQFPDLPERQARRLLRPAGHLPSLTCVSA